MVYVISISIEREINLVRVDVIVVFVDIFCFFCVIFFEIMMVFVFKIFKKEKVFILYKE